MSDLVYERLRTGVLRGAFPPGSVLRQEELARRYGASRVPLREAMTRLEAEGILVLRPRRGYAVVSLDRAEIKEIFALRALVEQHAGRLAAQARSRDDLIALERPLKRMDRLDLSKPRQVEAWLDANAEFHLRLFESTGRRHVARTALMLRDLVEPYIRVEVGLTKGVQEAQREHRAIFEALREGATDTLGELCRRHCENTAVRLIEALEGKPEG